MHNQAPIQRRKSTRIYVGNVPIGDGAPIAVQSMTNTRTTDVEATVNQIKALERVGADIGPCLRTDDGRGRSVQTHQTAGLTCRWWLTSTSTIALH
ncbi:4-hydroxy-3-methylbut-2-en-1-yl diphosphate synthase [Escherichia coli]|uniref:4-hydroxy-3-methylbut-2-en-1-yl diphosphate synthase n=1 Tax=Escherichia coli TaxID=562 RepID=A0A376TU76_ECOLX|nr:4-hydroxy-3-methylbut-2-en-1-yl diphosphate synthase [Escherichia coli]